MRARAAVCCAWQAARRRCRPMPLWKKRKVLAKRAVRETAKQGCAILFLGAVAYYFHVAWQYWGGVLPAGAKQQ